MILRFAELTTTSYVQHCSLEIQLCTSLGYTTQFTPFPSIYLPENVNSVIANNYHLKERV